MKCPKCKKEARWVENKEVYGRNYGKSYMIWLCKDCDVYVGCHKNTKKPLGTMVDRELREYRKTAKNLFIQKKLNGSWKNHNLKKDGYDYLKNLFGYEFHFGSSTVEDCKKIIKELR